MRANVDVTFHPSWWNKYAGIDFSERFFFDAPWRVEADRAMRRTLYDYFGEYGIGEKDPAPRPILFSDLIACGFLYSQLLGCDVSFAPNDAPQVMAAELTDEQASTLTVPDLDTSLLWKKVVAQIRYLQDRFGRVESAINLQGVQNIALDLRGQQLFIDYYDDEDIAHNLLSAATKLSLDIGRRLYAVSDTVSGGVTSIVKQVTPHVYLTSNCSVTMISNAMYCRHLLSYDTMLAEAFLDFGIHHCGNNMENVIEGYLKVPNLHFLEIGAGSSLEKISGALRSHGREDIVCCIRYSPVKLKNASAETIREDTEKAIQAFGSDRTLCFSCVGIDKDVPLEQVGKYLAALKEGKRGNGE